MKEKIIAFIQQHEGSGFAVVPGDAGGATCRGVTLATYRSVYGNNKTEEDLKRLTDAEWLYIFDRLFWNKMWCDEIPLPIACAMADFAYNAGVPRAVKYAQAIAHTTADGVVGSKTINALRKQTSKAFVAEYLDMRRKYYLRLAGFKDDAEHLWLARTRPAAIKKAESASKQRKFIAGWLNRVNDLEKMLKQ